MHTSVIVLTLNHKDRSMRGYLERRGQLRGKEYGSARSTDADSIYRDQIKVKSGSKIQEIVPDGLVFEDGSKITADVILYATGFEKDVRRHVADVVGQEAAKLEPIWGLNVSLLAQCALML